MVDIETDIKNCVAALQAGGVILYPTDTVWGLGCDALDASAIRKVYALKNRPPHKSMIVLLADARDILQYVAAPPPDIIAIVGDFERPTTVVYDNAIGLPDELLNEDGSIAIRVTSDPFCKALIKRFRRPIVSTSANLSGAPTPILFSEIGSPIVQGADYTVNHRQNDTTVRPPSRIIRMSDEGVITILRP